MQPAIFLDRDGTVIKEKEYLRDPDEVELLPGVVPALKQLQRQGFILIMVTNQSGISRGYYNLEDMHAVNAHILQMLRDAGVDMDLRQIYFCPHAPGEKCACRKPATKLVQQAVREWDIDLPRSFVIGDKLSDVELGLNLAIPAILVKTGYGQQHAPQAIGKAAYIAENAENAAEWILKKTANTLNHI